MRSSRPGQEAIYLARSRRQVSGRPIELPGGVNVRGIVAAASGATVLKRASGATLARAGLSNFLPQLMNCTTLLARGDYLTLKKGLVAQPSPDDCHVSAAEFMPGVFHDVK